jgi:hypothetical protein
MTASLALLLLIGSTANADAPGAANRALAFVTLLVHQKYQDAYGLFDDQVKAQLPSAKLESVWKNVIGQVGAFKRTGATKTVVTEDHQVVFVESVFARGTLWVQVAYDKDRKIGGLHFLPKTLEQP